MKYFKIIEVTVSTAKQNKIVQFDGKLDGKFTHLKGVHVSANVTNDTKAIANVSLSFNGGNQNTITHQLFKRSLSNHRRRVKTLTTMMPLVKNSYLKGYIEDYGVSGTYPYTVKIYLELVAKPCCNE